MPQTMKSEAVCDSKHSGSTLSVALNTAANAFTQVAGAFLSKGKDKINLTRFYSITANGKECILALIGYDTRWQAWLVEDSETTCLAEQNIVESIREFCLLPGRGSPPTGYKHFLIGLVHANSDRLVVFSPEENREILSLEIGGGILGVQCTAEALLIRIRNQIHGYNPFTMTHNFTILTSPTVNSASESYKDELFAPFSLSSWWVAYPGFDEQARTIQEEIVSSPTSAWDYVHKMGEIAYKASNGVISRISKMKKTQKQEKEPFADENTAKCFVMIKKVSNRETIACFRAHDSPIACLKFSHGGLMLATASVTGKRVKIFEIHKRRSGKAESPYQVRVKHILYRGMTENWISWISFSPDDTMVSVSSGGRGTTHVYTLESIGDLEGEDDKGKEMYSTQSIIDSDKKNMDLSSVAKIQGRWGIRVQLAPLRVYEALGSTCYSKSASRSSHFGRVMTKQFSEADLTLYLFIISESGTLQSFCMQPEVVCNHQDDSAIRMTLVQECKMDTGRKQISIEKLHELSVQSLERPQKTLKCVAKSYGFRHPNKSKVWGQNAFKLQ